MSTPGNEWFWAYHTMREFGVPLERYAGFTALERLSYMAACATLWDARREQNAES